MISSVLSAFDDRALRNRWITASPRSIARPPPRCAGTSRSPPTRAQPLQRRDGALRERLFKREYVRGEPARSYCPYCVARAVLDLSPQRVCRHADVPRDVGAHRLLVGDDPAGQRLEGHTPTVAGGGGAGAGAGAGAGTGAGAETGTGAGTGAGARCYTPAMPDTLLRFPFSIAVRPAPVLSVALLALLALGCTESRSASDAAAPTDMGGPTTLLDAGRDLALSDLGTPEGCVPYVAPSCAQDVTGMLGDHPYTHLTAFENTASGTFIGFTLRGVDARGCSVPQLTFERSAPYEGTQDVTAGARDGAGGVISFPGQVRVSSYESSATRRADGTYGIFIGTLLLSFPSGVETSPMDVPICERRSAP